LRGAASVARAAAVSLALLAVCADAASAAQTAPSVALSESQLTLGTPVSVSGVVAQGAGETLMLEAEAWPSHRYAPIATTASGPAGAYAFAPLRPDRDMLLRVAVAGAGPEARSAPVALVVFPRVRLSARSLGPGRTLLTLGVRHARTGGGAGTTVRWFTATPGSHAYHLVAVSGSRELPSGLLEAQTVIDPPARRFTFRVCLNPPWEAAMGTVADRGSCPRAAFVLPAGNPS
jgi:hypothetical protein